MRGSVQKILSVVYTLWLLIVIAYLIKVICSLKLEVPHTNNQLQTYFV